MFVFAVSDIVVLCIPWMLLMCQTAVFHILIHFAALNWGNEYVCMYVKNFWISAVMANLVNCFCYDLCCIVPFSMVYTAFVFISGDCSIDICILFLFFVFVWFCFVLIFIVSLSFVCLSFSDKFHVRLFVQQSLWTYEMIWYVCMYVKNPLYPLIMRLGETQEMFWMLWRRGKINILPLPVIQTLGH